MLLSVNYLFKKKNQINQCYLIEWLFSHLIQYYLNKTNLCTQIPNVFILQNIINI